MTKLDRRMLEYGRAREWRQLNRIHKSESQLISAIQGTILDTITECEKEANLWLMTYARSDGISLSEAKKAVRLKDIRELEAKAKEYVKRRKDLGFAFSEEAMKEMRRYNFGMKMNRLELLQHNLALDLGMGTVDVEEIIGRHLTYATEEELRRQAGLLGLNIPDPDIMRINAEAIVNASFHEENFSQRIWKNKQELEETLDKGIKKSVMMGHNPVTWARSLKELLRDTENDAMYKMKRIAITESGRVQIAAQRISYETAGFSQYMVICEPTACPHCMKFDGEVFAIADLVQGENAPMFHPFCRCSTTPYMSREEVEEGFRELEGELNGRAGDPVMRDLADISEIKTNEDIKVFAEQLIDNLGIDRVDITVNVKGTLDYGHCTIDKQTTQKELRFNEYVLNANDARAIEYRVKTGFHEAFHLLSHGREWDGLTSKWTVKEAWRSLEETFTETSAHYLLHRYGVTRKIAPSYAKELATNLPRLKRLAKYSECNTVQDFGELAFTERQNGSGAKWMQLSRQMKKIDLPDGYYEQYHPYIKSHESELLDMFLENSPGLESYRSSMESDLKNAMNKNRLTLNENEQVVYYGVMACAMQKEGIR